MDAYLGYVALGLTILGGIAVALSNVLYSRPRIERLQEQVRQLQDDASTAIGVGVEKDKRISFLEDMVKSVPAFSDIASQLKAHEDRSQAREEKIVAALEAIANRLERHTDRRKGDHA